MADVNEQVEVTAAELSGMLIEPSDGERASWSMTTEAYVIGLEQLVDVSSQALASAKAEHDAAMGEMVEGLWALLEYGKPSCPRGVDAWAIARTLIARHKQSDVASEEGAMEQMGGGHGG